MQATRESRVVCVCVCVLLQDGLFSCQTVNSLPLPDSSVSTDYNQRLFSFHFFHSGLLCVLRVVGKQEDLYIKESLLWRGKKMMFPTSFSCSNQLNSTPSPRFQCNNNCVLSLHFFPHSSCLVTSYMLHTSISSSSSSSSGYVSNLVFFQWISEISELGF